MPSLVAIGACYVDTVLTVPYYPSEDEKLRASSIVRRRGGNCPNTLEVLQQLLEEKQELVGRSTEISLHLCTVLPSRSCVGTQQIKSSFGPLVDLTHCIHREEHTEPASCYITRSLVTDSRTIVNYNSLPDMTPDEFSAMANKLGDTVCLYHFELQGRIPSTTLACMGSIRRRYPKIKISVEIEKPNRKGLEQLADEADIVFYSKSWAQSVGYRSAAECVHAQLAHRDRTTFYCCTWGREGAAAIDVTVNISEPPVHRPAYTATQVIDTIGAGDTFIAGMLYGITCHGKDWSLEQKLSFANELAGRKVGQEGFEGLGRLMRPLL